MINWIVSFETYASVQIEEKLVSLFSANQIRENSGSANQRSSFSENSRVFSKIAKSFSEFQRH